MIWPEGPKLKYDSTLITFTEVPDEISLCLNITNCPCNCQGCFEPWLREDRGDRLTFDVLRDLIEKHPHISCVCFMGGDRFYDEISVLIMELRCYFPKLKWCMYSGRQEMNRHLATLVDYYKVGPYIAEAGPMDKKTTNQRFYKKENEAWVDITYRFQKERV